LDAGALLGLAVRDCGENRWVASSSLSCRRICVAVSCLSFSRFVTCSVIVGRIDSKVGLRIYFCRYFLQLLNVNKSPSIP
jgi:hypothetical protein